MHQRTAGIAALAFAGASAIAAPSAFAQDEADRPELFSQLIECRQIEAIEERVLCYDQKVDALDRAEAEDELIVVDREEVEEARREQFGLNSPEPAVLANREVREKAKPIDEVETTVASAGQFGRGKWRIRMEGGGLWEQIDSRSLYRAPRQGDKVEIKRASLGSFLVKVGNNSSIRMRRVE